MQHDQSMFVVHQATCINRLFSPGLRGDASRLSRAFDAQAGSHFSKIGETSYNEEKHVSEAVTKFIRIILSPGIESKSYRRAVYNEIQQTMRVV